MKLKTILLFIIAVSGAITGILLDKYNINTYQIKQSLNKIISFNFNKSINKSSSSLKSFEDIKQYPPAKKLSEITSYCHDFLKYGNPSFSATQLLAKSNIYLCRDGYIVGYNYKSKEASWVAFRLTKSKVANKIKRKDFFTSDKNISYNFRAKLSDYKRSGYDRGHLASYASMDFSQKSAKESFLLSNMSPQKGGLNQQGWERLEQYERIWANMYNEIYVYTGPIYKQKYIHKTIGKDRIAVPDFFFKIIYVPKNNKAIAFVMPNSKVSKHNVANYRDSIKDIENRTGLKFLINIPNRKNIVNNVSSMWRTSYY